MKKLILLSLIAIAFISCRPKIFDTSEPQTLYSGIIDTVKLYSMSNDGSRYSTTTINYRGIKSKKHYEYQTDNNISVNANDTLGVKMVITQDGTGRDTSITYIQLN